MIQRVNHVGMLHECQKSVLQRVGWDGYVRPRSVNPGMVAYQTFNENNIFTFFLVVRIGDDRRFQFCGSYGPFLELAKG